MKIGRRHAIIAAASGALLLSVQPALAGLARSRIFQPPAAPLSLTGLPTGARFLEVTTADGLALRGIVVDGAADKPVLLVFHGNASSAQSVTEWLAPLAHAGYTIVAAEYRGYSGGPGKPSEQGLAQDARAFYAAARSLAGKRRVIVVGHSLGGGVAFGLARTERLDALVTIGTFASITAMAPRIARAFISDRFDNLATIATVDEPVFITHGTADAVVPSGNARLLFDAAARSGRQGGGFVLRNMGHQPPAEAVRRVIDAVTARLDNPTAPLRVVGDDIAAATLPMR